MILILCEMLSGPEGVQPTADPQRITAVREGPFSAVPIIKIYRPLWFAQGGAAYLLSQKGAQKLLNLVERRGMNWEADNFILHHHLWLHMYTTARSLCYSTEGLFGSDTQDNAELTDDQWKLPSWWVTDDNYPDLLRFKLAVRGEADEWYVKLWMELAQIQKKNKNFDDARRALESADGLEPNVDKREKLLADYTHQKIRDGIR